MKVSKKGRRTNRESQVESCRTQVAGREIGYQWLFQVAGVGEMIMILL